MNKEAWEIKKLGEVCNLYQPKTISANEMKSDGEYPVFGANGIIGKYDKFNHEHPELLMTCRGATCGTLNVSEPYSWINGNAMVIHPRDTSLIKFEFVYYQLLGADLSCVITGAAQPQITRQSLEPLKFIVPPLPIQEQIVAELDTLNDILAKKREQLAQLNTLAQASFYHLFGDPVENERGWEKIKFGDLYDSRLGKMLDAKKQVETDDLCLYIGNSNVQWGKFSLENLQSMTFTIKEKEILELKQGDLLICEGGEAGRCAIWQSDNTNIYFQKAIHRARQKSSNINSLYTQSLFLYLKKNGGLKDFITKATIEHLTGEKLKIIPLPIPPLALQNQFAEQIEAIEKQKELINESIKEVQKLFDYTMDKYFN